MKKPLGTINSKGLLTNTHKDHQHGYFTTFLLEFFMSQILIKYGVQSLVPSSLAVGELAYSESAKKLFIGTVVDGSPAVVEVGGADLVSRVGGVEGFVTTLQAEMLAAKGDITSLLDIINGVNGQPGLVAAVADHATRLTDVESALGLGASGGTPTFTDLTVTGNLTVGGTMTVTNTEEMSIKDPVIHLGAGTAGADGMDRGVSFEHFDSASGTVKTGFFGMDATDGKFTFLRDATVAGNDFSGAEVGIIKANIEGTATGFTNNQKITVEGEATGTVEFNGTAPVTLTVAVKGFSAAEPNSVVRRDADGVSGFTAVHTANLSQMAGIDGLVGSTMSDLTNFVINGGSF